MMIDNHITNKQFAEGLLRNELAKHYASICDCKEYRGEMYPCRAGEWLAGIISSKQIIEERGDK